MKSEDLMGQLKAIPVKNLIRIQHKIVEHLTLCQREVLQSVLAENKGLKVLKPANDKSLQMQLHMPADWPAISNVIHKIGKALEGVGYLFNIHCVCATVDEPTVQIQVIVTPLPPCLVGLKEMEEEFLPGGDAAVLLSTMK